MATFEQRLGAWMITFYLIVVAVVALHWWQDGTDPGLRWIDSCHTMDDRRCGPHEPLIKIKIGGTDGQR